MIGIYLAVILNFSYAQNENKVPLSPCQIEMAKELRKKFNLEKLPLKIEEASQFCDKNFCTTFKFTKGGNFKKNLLPAGAEIRFCKDGGLTSIARNDGQGLDAGDGLVCSNRMDYCGSTISCELGKPYKTHEFILPAGTKINFVSGENIYSFYLLENTKNGSKILKAKTGYKMVNGQPKEGDSDMSCETN